MPDWLGGKSPTPANLFSLSCAVTAQKDGLSTRYHLLLIMKEKIKEFLVEFVADLKALWEGLPKFMKVACYMLVAGVLDQLSRDMSPNSFSFLPEAYRVLFFNFLTVLLVEGVKYLKAKK